MKKNHSQEWRALWDETSRNHLPLVFTILVRAMVAVGFVFYICHHLGRFSNAMMITLGIVIMVVIVLSRSIKRRSILLERLFINNLRSRDIEAQVHGRKRPLYEGRLLDRDIHIAEFDVPADTLWAGHSLMELRLGSSYGVHVSSIMRGGHRINIPDGASVLYPADRLQVIGSDDQLAKFGAAVQSNVMPDDADIEQREMKLRQLIIGADSRFVGRTLAESGIRSRYGCMVVGIEEGQENLSAVAPKRRFREGDIIWVVGEERSLAALMAQE